MIDVLVSTYKTYLLEDCIVIHSVPDAKVEECAARDSFGPLVYLRIYSVSLCVR